jgi:4-carboxymuconolactone decarboxylase
MPRLAPITEREQLTGDALLSYDSIVESRGRINGPQSMHMYVPEIAKCSIALSDVLLHGSGLSEHDVELAIITAAREMDCAYVWASHVVSGLKAGLRPEAIDIVANFGNIDALRDGEAIIVQYGREVLGHHSVAQETFDSALSKFGESGTIALGALMGYYAMLSCTLIATDMQPSEGAPVLPSR